MYKSLVEFQRGNSIGKVMAFNGTQILEKILLVEQTWGLPGGAGGKKKNSACSAGDKRHRFDPWVRKISWSKK